LIQFLLIVFNFLLNFFNSSIILFNFNIILPYFHNSTFDYSYLTIIYSNPQFLFSIILHSFLSLYSFLSLNSQKYYLTIYAYLILLKLIFSIPFYSVPKNYSLISQFLHSIKISYLLLPTLSLFYFSTPYHFHQIWLFSTPIKYLSYSKHKMSNISYSGSNYSLIQYPTFFDLT
jgi:hypothetical protein